MTVSMPLLLAVMKLHVPINLIFCSGSIFIFLQQLELSEKMDSNFSITINTVTFVRMSFIFLGIIPFVRAIVYSQTTPSCCVMSLFLSHVSRSIQFRNVLLSLIFAISSFLVKRTTPFDKIDLVDQFYWNSLFGNFRLNFLVFMEIKEFIPNYRWKSICC